MKKRKQETVTLSMKAYGAIEHALILAINEAYTIEGTYDKCYQQQYEGHMWDALNALNAAKADGEETLPPHVGRMAAR